MKYSRRDFFKMCLAAVTALGLGKVSGCARRKEPDDTNPYKYDIEKFKKIDPGLLLYEELSSFPVNISDCRGFCVSRDDFLFVSDSEKLSIYDTKGRLENTFPFPGETKCIAAENKTQLFAGIKDHIEVYDTASGNHTAWESMGEQALITGIALKDDRIAAADAGNRQLWIFSREGKLISTIDATKNPSDQKGFIIPSPYFDVKFDNTGLIWVVNPGRLRLEQYTSGGGFIKSFGRPSMDLEGFSGCCNPTHFMILPDEDFVTVEKGLIRIKVYNKNGVLKGVVAGPESFSEGTNGIIPAFDSKGLIYLADPGSGKIRIFRLK